MSFTLAILAMLGYSLQHTLMAKHYRNIDPLSAITYRGLSLGITMLPLLCFVAPSAFNELIAIAPSILFAAITCAIGNAYSAASIRCLPVGIACAICTGTLVICITAIDIFYFQERISNIILICVAVIIIANALIGVAKSSVINLEKSAFTRCLLRRWIRFFFRPFNERSRFGRSQIRSLPSGLFMGVCNWYYGSNNCICSRFFRIH